MKRFNTNYGVYVSDGFKQYYKPQVHNLLLV